MKLKRPSGLSILRPDDDVVRQRPATADQDENAIQRFFNRLFRPRKTAEEKPSSQAQSETK